MAATPEQLRGRWESDRGRALLRRVVESAAGGWRDWSSLLAGLDHVDEVPDRRDLRYANLAGVDADGACLSQADLTGVNLQGASLIGAYLSGVKLQHASLSRARFSGADLRDADLSHSSLSMAILQNAILRRARLVEANLRDVVLNAACCQGADFTGARMNQASLVRADLRRAVLDQAALDGANLCGACLVQTSLKGAFLTGIKLHGAMRDGWCIDEATCDYLYCDADGVEQWPQGRVFEPGEFARLYAPRPTVEYVFEVGLTPIDVLIMGRVAHIVGERRPELGIELAAVETRGCEPTVTFVIADEGDREAALAEIKQEYERKRAHLSGKADHLYDVLRQMVDDTAAIDSV